MKRINLALIACALILTTACTDTDKVLPANISQGTLDFQGDTSKEIILTQGPNILAEFSGTTGQTGEAAEKNGELACNQFGELALPANREAGSYIKQADGQFLEVTNVDLFDYYTSGGRVVAFGYVKGKYVKATNNLPTPVKLTCIWFLDQDTPCSEVAKEINTKTN